MMGPFQQNLKKQLNLLLTGSIRLMMKIHKRILAKFLINISKINLQPLNLAEMQKMHSALGSHCLSKIIVNMDN